MPNDDAAKISRRATALIGVAIYIFPAILCERVAKGAGSPSRSEPASIAPATERSTDFTIVDGDKCETIRTGKHKFSGTLKIQFAGRILPHESTDAVLYGKGVSSLKGKFDRVEVPKGWRYDITALYEI